MSRTRRKGQRRKQHHGNHPNKSQRRRDNYNAKKHAKTRASERYGLELTNADLLSMARTITERHSQYVTTQARGRQIHVLTHAGIKLAVLYDPNNSVVLSTLPSDHHELTKRGINLIDPRLTALADAFSPT